MKIRGYDKENEEIKLSMTPMIDIVFQLLVFFIMTYKVTTMEGDYNIRMPSAAAEPTLTEETLEDFLLVRLIADPDSRFLQTIFHRDFPRICPVAFKWPEIVQHKSTDKQKSAKTYLQVLPSMLP